MAERMDAFGYCHPVVNVLYFLPALVFSMILIHPIYLIISLTCALCYNVILFGAAKALRRALKLLSLFLMVSLINPLLNTYGKTVLFRVFSRPYTLEALYYGMALGTVFYTVLLWFFCWNRVMTADRFTCLFGNLMPGLSLLLVMVFRLVPLYDRKARQISGALQCIGRGVAGKGTYHEKAEAGMTVLTALTGWALESSVQTADSMRSRGYGAARRTSYLVYCFRKRDAILSAIIILTAGIVVFCLACGCGKASYTPEFYIAPLDTLQAYVGAAAYAGLLLIPIILDLREELLWHYSISKI